MKALTIRQPWASLIAAGIKDVENRSWPTAHRGPLLIHAGMGLDHDALAEWRDCLPATLPRGRVIARVELVDCVRNSRSKWAIPGEWHWALADPLPMSRTPRVRGRLGLFALTSGGRVPADRTRIAPTRKERR
ncbi:MAG TPA: ASCH domain-containing protein [Verrucomicrobiae bacterium]|nr:ASCH domain-containing protein [Verrucomicrobiae bacterium]